MGRFFDWDTSLSKWQDLLILMVWPIIFHAAALLFSFAHTRPKSYWTERFPCLFGNPDSVILQEQQSSVNSSCDTQGQELKEINVTVTTKGEGEAVKIEAAENSIEAV